MLSTSMKVSGDCLAVLDAEAKRPAFIESVTVLGVRDGDHPLHHTIRVPIMLAYVKLQHPVLVRLVDRAALRICEEHREHGVPLSQDAITNYLEAVPSAATMFADPDDRLRLREIVRLRMARSWVALRMLVLGTECDSTKWGLGFNDKVSRLITLKFDPEFGGFRPARLVINRQRVDYVSSGGIMSAANSAVHPAEKLFWNWQYQAMRLLRESANAVCQEDGEKIVDVQYVERAAPTPEFPDGQVTIVERGALDPAGPVEPRVRFTAEPLTTSYQAIAAGKAGCRIKLFTPDIPELDPWVFPAADKSVWLPIDE